jgi:hypothetical protein
MPATKDEEEEEEEEEEGGRTAHTPNTLYTLHSSA